MKVWAMVSSGCMILLVMNLDCSPTSSLILSQDYLWHVYFSDGVYGRFEPFAVSVLLVHLAVHAQPSQRLDVLLKVGQ